MHHFSGTGGHSASLAWTDMKSILACSVYHFVAIIRERERHCENVNRSFICCSQGERTAGLKLHILFLILIPQFNSSLHHLPLKFTFILTFRCIQNICYTFVRSPGRSDESRKLREELINLLILQTSIWAGIIVINNLILLPNRYTNSVVLIRY